MAKTDMERLLEKCYAAESGCWQWIGAQNRKGYGQLFFRGKLWVSHRVAYTIFVGEIPEGMTVDHLCFNKGCINPAHLEPVTALENTQRAKRAGRHRPSTQYPPGYCAAGHQYTEDNVAIRPDGRRRCKMCARLKRRRQILRLREEAKRNGTYRPPGRPRQCDVTTRPN